MAASVHSPSPPSSNKESTSLMVSPLLFSPASDKRFWSKLRTRIDSILDNRQSKIAEETNVDPCSDTHFAVAGECDRSKRMKEDSLLLLRGFDSVAQNLSQLSSNLGNALQGARHLAEPPTLREIFQGSLKKQEDLEEQQNEAEEEEKKGLKRKYDPSESLVEQEKDNDHGFKDKRLKKVRNLAISMATKSAALARELKSIKLNLCFVQERCALLEEENKRLQDGFCGGGGDGPEEDDLMRLQMEVLLAEKSRLANENANLFRENHCLHQLVEYHQVTSQDLSASYEQLIQGVCLDFSSPDEDAEEDETAKIPKKDLLGFSTSLDGCFREAQEQ